MFKKSLSLVRSNPSLARINTLARHMSDNPAKVACGSKAKVKVGLVQMTAVNNKEINFKKNQEYVSIAKSQGCELICFPECFSFIGARPGEAQSAAEEVTGPTVDKYKALAAEHGVWLSLGGFQEVGPADSVEGKIYNSHLIINDRGEIASVYRKIHLFDVPMTGLVESKQSLPGKEIKSCHSPAGCLGVTVCYDVRFPEMYQKLRFLYGAQILLIPSAFAMKTGEAHWETLLRCRAIENQCYVLAAAQVGQHNEDGNKRQSWGHSLAIDPWGKILVDMGTTTGVAVVEIDQELVSTTRDNMPIHMHRRYDLYGDGPHGSEKMTDEEREEWAKKNYDLFFG